jgi:hypothetical protein
MAVPCSVPRRSESRPQANRPRLIPEGFGGRATIRELAARRRRLTERAFGGKPHEIGALRTHRRGSLDCLRTRRTGCASADAPMLFFVLRQNTADGRPARNPDGAYCLDAPPLLPMMLDDMMDAKRCPIRENLPGLGMLRVYQTIVGRTLRG